VQSGWSRAFPLGFGAPNGPPVQLTEVEPSLTLPSVGELATAAVLWVTAAPTRAAAAMKPISRWWERDVGRERMGDSSMGWC
jgi:hypothetical protein